MVTSKLQEQTARLLFSALGLHVSIKENHRPEWLMTASGERRRLERAQKKLDEWLEVSKGKALTAGQQEALQNLERHVAKRREVIERAELRKHLQGMEALKRRYQHRPVSWEHEILDTMERRVRKSRK